MGFLSGIISDRLRSTQKTAQILHNPHPDRGATPKRGKVPKHVKGTQLSNPGRTAKKK
jgi:hypothetical protein